MKLRPNVPYPESSPPEKITSEPYPDWGDRESSTTELGEQFDYHGETLHVDAFMEAFGPHVSVDGEKFSCKGTLSPLCTTPKWTSTKQFFRTLIAPNRQFQKNALFTRHHNRNCRREGGSQTQPGTESSPRVPISIKRVPLLLISQI